jgi:hypothetical protein
MVLPGKAGSATWSEATQANMAKTATRKLVWKPFSFVNGKYQVMVPIPCSQTEPVTGNNVPGTYYRFIADDHNLAYFVVHRTLRLPPGNKKLEPLEDYAKRCRDYYVENWGTLEESQDMTLLGSPGLEFTMVFSASKRGHGRFRIAFVEKDILEIWVEGPKDRLGDVEASKFLDSLSIAKDKSE